MESPSIPPAPADPGSATAPIIGRVTKWYFYRRMIPTASLLLVFGLLFLYDGKIGYPKDNAIAAKKVWFETAFLKSYNDAKAGGPVKLEAWVNRARAEGWPIDQKGDPARWVSWAAEGGMPEKPKQWTDAEIAQQYWFGGACILASLIVTLVMLSNRGKTIRAEADHWISPEGRKILFANVTKLDLRKWRQKGLGYAWYRDSAGGPLRRTTLDDLKFTHVQAILDRLRANYKGEVIQNPPRETESEANAREPIR